MSRASRGRSGELSSQGPPRVEALRIAGVHVGESNPGGYRRRLCTRVRRWRPLVGRPRKTGGLAKRIHEREARQHRESVHDWV